MKILFQGDSITDAFRNKERHQFMGSGYPTIVAGKLGYDNPGVYEFSNRGVSGDRVTNLLTRVKRDMINLNPDLISILVGINDVWHELTEQDGINASRYELIFNILLDQLQEELPDVKLMILEPFVLHGIATNDIWNVFRSETEKRAIAARQVAQKHNAIFVPLIEKFDDAYKKAPEGFWLMDGVHPTAAGHELIAQEWIKAFNTQVI